MTKTPIKLLGKSTSQRAYAIITKAVNSRDESGKPVAVPTWEAAIQQAERELAAEAQTKGATQDHEPEPPKPSKPAKSLSSTK